MIRDLFDAARERLGVQTNAELGRRLGVGRAFMCNMQNGRKGMPLDFAVRLTELTNLPQAEYEALLAKGTEDGPLPGVPEVQREVQLQSGVLPDSASGDSASVAAERVPAECQAGPREGRGEPTDLLGQCGESPVARVPRKEKLKRGTRAATVLVAGRTYYPDKASDHTHRRIISLVRRPDQPTAVIYSIGGDNNLVCDRNTFIRWMDPTRYHDGTQEVRIPAAGAAEDQPKPSKDGKPVRSKRTAQAVAA